MLMHIFHLIKLIKQWLNNGQVDEQMTEEAIKEAEKELEVQGEVSKLDSTNNIQEEIFLPMLDEIMYFGTT